MCFCALTQAKRREQQLKKELEELEKHAPKKVEETMRFQTEDVVAGKHIVSQQESVSVRSFLPLLQARVCLTH